MKKGTSKIKHKTQKRKFNSLKGKTNKKKSKTKKSTKSNNNKVKQLIVSKIMSDNEIQKREGTYFPATFFKDIVQNDCDVYYQKSDKLVLLCSFRKNVISQEICQDGFEALHRYASRWHTNRGAAAGLINSLKMPPHVDRLTKKERFRAYYYSKKDGKFHKDHISNLAQSNIIGYYDIADRNIKGSPPCRETKFNKDYPAKWQAVQALLRKIGQLFKKLVPDKYNKQYNIASQTPKYQIKGTPFSTATINYNWQTALHKDKGDYVNGFGNLIVMERGKYNGGYIGFPQFGVCIDVRQQDFLAMDVHQWHSNTDIELLTQDAARVTMVCYLREKMIRCK